jgi:protein MpaA
MQKLTQKLKNVLIAVPRPVRYISIISILLLGLGIGFMLPKNVQFAYATSETCVNYLSFAPTLQKQVSDDAFKADLSGVVSIFGLPVASTKLCVAPLKSPEQGSLTTHIGLFGGNVVSKPVQIHVPATPKAAIANIKAEGISASRNLTIPLSDKDALHDYTLTIADKRATCAASTEEAIDCQLPKLQLGHGEAYTVALYQSFKDDTPIKLGDIHLKTLSAMQLLSSDITEGQTLYTAPTALKTIFNKEVSSASVKIIEKESQSVIETQTTINGAEVMVTLSRQLERSKQYQLIYESVEGTDKSTLSNRVTMSFATSGGPKVIAVSVGASGVSQNAQIVVSFDQPLKADTDVAQFAHSEGVTTSVRRLSDTQISYTLQNAALCTPFRLIIEKELPSGSNEAKSDTVWTHNARTVCGVAGTVGTSVQGRPITAHYFGNGSTTLLFTAAIHGSEASSYATMQAWVQHLQSNPVPADKRIVVVPNANPDGIANGTRNNARNVNVDRNFPASNWSASIDTAAGTLPQGGGTSPGSEPEAAALINLTRQLRPRLSVSFHSQGRLVGANMIGDSSAIGGMYASTVGYSTMFNSAEDVMGYGITGEYEDWMGQEMGIPAILVELPSNSGNYLNSQMNALNKLLAL